MPVEEPPAIGRLEKQEQNRYDEGHRQLDLNLRRVVGYTAWFVAMALYVLGMTSAAVFAGLLPRLATAPQPEAWHIVVAVLVALFSVPTVLFVSLLRSTTQSKKHGEADSIYTTIGEQLVKFIEKLSKKDD